MKNLYSILKIPSPKNFETQNFFGEGIVCNGDFFILFQ